MGWDITFRHTDIKVLARCATKVQSRHCTIELSKNWGDLDYDPLNRRELDILAWHEICHLLLADMVSMAEYRFVTQDEIDRTAEEIVVRLENYHRSIT